MGPLNKDAETKIRLRVTLRRVLTVDEYWWTWEMKNWVEVKTRTLLTDWSKRDWNALKSLRGKQMRTFALTLKAKRKLLLWHWKES